MKKRTREILSDIYDRIHHLERSMPGAADFSNASARIIELESELAATRNLLAEERSCAERNMQSVSAELARQRELTRKAANDPIDAATRSGPQLPLKAEREQNGWCIRVTRDDGVQLLVVSTTPNGVVIGHLDPTPLLGAFVKRLNEHDDAE